MSGRLQHVGPVPVLREMTRIHRAVREVTIVRRAVLLVQPVGDLLADGGENHRLSRDITVPVEPIDLGSMRLVGNEGVPGFQRRTGNEGWRPERLGEAGRTGNS